MTKQLLLESTKDTDLTKQYISFWIENKRFGIDILDVKEIYSDVSVTPIYHSTEDIRGYINIRGEIYLVADLRKILGLQKTFINVEEKLIIFKDMLFESFGIVIDKIADVVNINNNEIEMKTKTGETRVKVLGTSFNIRAYPETDRIEVVVNSGKVLF